MGEVQQGSAAVPSKNTWLATLGCCASWSRDEDEAELHSNVHEKDVQLVFDQPQPYHHARPNTSHSVGTSISQWVTTTVHRSSSRTSRPIISGPTEFRHVNEQYPPRRSSLRPPSLRPLELAIYEPENRLSPLPDFTESDWTKVLPSLEFPEQAVLHSRPTSFASSASRFSVRRKPVRTSSSTTTSSRSSSRLSMNPTIDFSLSLDTTFDGYPTALQALPSIPDSPNTSSKLTSPLPAPSHSRSNTNLSLPLSRPQSHSPSRSRSNTDPAPPLRTRPSFLTTKSEIDTAIRELQTIIEERRADDYRASANSFASSGLPPPSPGQHVPAVAPSLRIRARSETLSEIGSAFSTPLVSKPLPLTPSQQRGMRPLLLATPPASPPATAGLKKSLSKASLASLKPKLSVWLRRQTSSASSSSFFNPGASGRPTPGKGCSGPAASQQAPFYKCIPPSNPGGPFANAHTHAQKPSMSSVSTFSSMPSLSGRTSYSTLRSPSTPIPSGGRDRSLSIRSGTSGRGLGKWKGEELVLGSKGEQRLADVLMEKDLRVDPLRMNPKTPVGVAF